MEGVALVRPIPACCLQRQGNLTSRALSISDIRPGFSLAGALRTGDITAQVDATLAVELVETSTGASLWSGSARATKSIGHVSVFHGGEFVFDAQDPEASYGVLVDALVEQVTRDFRATWIRRQARLPGGAKLM